MLLTQGAVVRGPAAAPKVVAAAAAAAVQAVTVVLVLVLGSTSKLWLHLLA
jgi:hypothetical protein